MFMHTTCSQMKNTETTDHTLLVKIGVSTSACPDTFFHVSLSVLFLFSFFLCFHTCLFFFASLISFFEELVPFIFFFRHVIFLRSFPSVYPSSSLFSLLSSFHIFLLHLSFFSSLHRAIFAVGDCRHHLSLLRDPPAFAPHMFPAVLVTIRWRARVLLLVVYFLKCFGCLSWLFLWTCFWSKTVSVILGYLVALCLHETAIHVLAAAPVLGG